MSNAKIKFYDGRFTLTCDTPSLTAGEKCAEEDITAFKEWSETYQNAVARGDCQSDLLALGEKISEWMNRRFNGFADRLSKEATTPLTVEFQTAFQPNDQEKQFLEAPWEVIADKKGHWAFQAFRYNPVRRLGDPGELAAASPHCLSLLFMAAAPRGVVELDFEGEEAAILRAVDGKQVVLCVEESGEIESLANRNAAEAPDVLHLSCHGANDPLSLAFETDQGDLYRVDPDCLNEKIGEHKPRLLFISACKTSAPGALLNSYSSYLIHQGYDAVLGWGASVGDGEATRYSAALYEHLSRNEAASAAAGWARWNLVHPKEGEAFKSGDWHMARLYLGPRGGGVLAEGQVPRTRRENAYSHKQFLDDQGKVKVAGRLEFVGRRKLAQKALRALRGHDHKGVLLWGFGRMGKSSLAARLANRLDGHRLAVVFGDYSAEGIWLALRRCCTEKEARELIDSRAPYIRNTGALRGAMIDLLQVLDSPQVNRPLLLAVDDFEQALDPPYQGAPRWHIKPELVDALTCLFEAFADSQTRSRLLFTSRYCFDLSHQGRDLTEILLSLQLTEMNDVERKKQVRAKERGAPAAQSDGDVARVRVRLLQESMQAAEGNPGLLDLLYGLCNESTEQGQAALDEIERFKRDGIDPDEQKLSNFIENLTIDKALQAVNKGEHDLLRYCTAFDMPIPIQVVDHLAETMGVSLNYRERLSGFSVLELYEDATDRNQIAAAVNALASAKLEKLSADEFKSVAEKVVRVLFDAWGGETGKRSWAMEFELARLALAANELSILAQTADQGVRWLNDNYQYRSAAQLAISAIQALDQAKRPVPLMLLQIACQVCQTIGDIENAKNFIKRAVNLLEGLNDEKKKEISYNDQGTIYGTYARLLQQSGEITGAEKYLNKAQQQFEQGNQLREVAVCKGEIARILTDQGEIEQALALHQEALKIYEDLGARRERAVTLGDIAHILTDQGEIEQALALHQEVLKIYEDLNSRRERAVTLGDIAKILSSKGEIEQALALFEEKQKICEDLGDRRSRAVTLGDIAGILTSKGEIEQALALHQERLKVNEELGDQDGIANVSWSIAQIEVQQEKYQEAFEHYAQSYNILLKLGRLDGICVVGTEFGILLCRVQQFDEGLAMLNRSRDGFIKLKQQQNVEYVEQAITDFTALREESSKNNSDA